MPRSRVSTFALPCAQGASSSSLAGSYQAPQERRTTPGRTASVTQTRIAPSGGPLPALAAKSATSTIPIVFSSGVDPVERGLVASLAWPGGNLTGFTIISLELMPKRLELLSELVPQASVFALLVNPNNAGIEPMIREVQEAARAKGLQLHVLKASTESEIDTAFAALVQLQAGALVVSADPFFNTRREQLVALAALHTVPAMYELREFAAGHRPCRCAVLPTTAALGHDRASPLTELSGPIIGDGIAAKTLVWASAPFRA